MAVCQLSLRHEYLSVLWGPHQRAGCGGGGEMRARRRRREFCAQRFSNLGGSEVGIQEAAPTAQDGILPNAKWFWGAICVTGGRGKDTLQGL